MGRHIKETLEALYPYLGTEGWFISGSYANPDVDFYNDIDIFFKTKKYFDEAVERTVLAGRDSLDTCCSNSAYGIISGFAVQYVQVRFGTPDEIFDKLDINVCRQGILPDGTCIQRPEAKDPLKILAPSVQSFSRLKKYCQKYHLSKLQRDSVITQCIRDYVDNDTFVHDYYKGTLCTHPLNYFLYAEFAKDHSCEVTRYLTAQALEYAPELLL